MSKDTIQFQGFGDEEAKEAEDFNNKGRSNFMKLKEGRNVVRILPARPGEKVMFHYFQHYVEDADGRGQGVACPKKNAQLDCPICDYAAALERGSAKDKERAKKYWASKRTLLNVIDRSDPDAGVKTLAVGKKILESLLSLKRNLEPGTDFVDPDDGFDISIERKGTGKNDTSYILQGSTKAKPMLPAHADRAKAIQTQPYLSTFAKIMEAEDIIELTGISVSQLPVSASTHRAQLNPGKGKAADTDGFDDFLDSSEAKDEGNF